MSFSSCQTCSLGGRQLRSELVFPDIWNLATSTWLSCLCSFFFTLFYDSLFLSRLLHNLCLWKLCVCLFIRPELQWSQLVEKKPTGGSGWQSKTMCTSTNWTHTTHPMAPAPMPVPQMVTCCHQENYAWWHTYIYTQSPLTPVFSLMLPLLKPIIIGCSPKPCHSADLWLFGVTFTSFLFGTQTKKLLCRE